MAGEDWAAATPEELDTLLEDALLLHDDAAVAALFERGAVLVAWPGYVRGGAQAMELLSQCGHLASAHLVQIFDRVALVVGDTTITVSCCGADRRWRFLASS